MNMEQKQKKYIYTECYPLSSFINQYDTCGSCIIHRLDGLYEDIYYFSKKDETIIAKSLDGWPSIDELKDNTKQFVIYHIDSGRYLISSNPQDFISQKEEPVILYDNYKYCLIPKSEAQKSKHFHEDDFFNEVLQTTNLIKKTYVEAFSKKQVKELNSTFHCALCGKKFKNTQKDWMWCATPYGNNHETYKILACPRCIEKAKGGEKYKYVTSNALVTSFSVLLIVVLLWSLLVVFENTLLTSLVVTGIITFVVGAIFYSKVEDCYAEKLLRLIGFNNFVEKNKAKSLSSLVTPNEMYRSESEEEEKKEKALDELSSDLICLISDVCVHYNVFHQAEYFYGKNLTKDETLPIEIKNQILIKAKEMFESKQRPYTKKILDYINLIAENINIVQSEDFSFITAEKPSLGFYIVISDLIIKELVTNYKCSTTLCGVTDYIDGEPILSKWYNSISTNICSLNSNKLIHTINYYVDKTVQVDPLTECPKAIYEVVNEYGNIEVVFDNDRMSEVINSVLKRIKIVN